MLARLIALTSIALFALTGSGAANGPYGSIQVGQWAGGAYTDDSTAAFSHCAAIGTYNSGISVLVGLRANHEWILGFTHPTWRLAAGEAFPIGLVFDKREQFNVFGSALSPSLIVVLMPQNSSLLSQFRKAALMTALAKGSVLNFALTSTSQLMPVLTNCVERMNKGGVSTAGDFAIVTPPSRQAWVSKPVTITSSPPTEPSLDYRVEALELATNFILKSGLQNPRVLGRSEIPTTLASNSAGWKSEEAFGFVRIISPDGDTKGIDVASAIAAADAKQCKGKFASGRMAKLIDDEVIFQGFSACEDTDGSGAAQYFVLPRKKGGFIVFSVVSDMKTEKARGAVKDEKVVDFQKAALVAVTDRH
jgi:hypothetical protein